MADNTVNELIKAALRKIGAIASGETPDDAEMQEGLIAMRHLLRAWSVKGQRVFFTTIVTHALTSGTKTYSTWPVAVVEPNKDGSSYIVGDVLTLTTGGTGATVTVTSIGSSGEVYGVSLTTQGYGYTDNTTSAVTGGSGSGATIDITTLRPVRIKSGYVNSDGLDHQVKIIGSSQYAEISQKSVGSNVPAWLWYNPTYGDGTIYLYPAGGGTLTLYVDVGLTDPTTLTEDVTLPGEYDDAIVWNLACDLCPEYGREPTPYMLRRGQMAKDTIISINASLSMPEMTLERPTRYSINEG